MIEHLFIANIIDILSGNGFYVYLLIFFCFSYIILSLFNWDLIKPFKYLGISLVIAFGFNIILEAFAYLIIEIGNTKAFLNSLFKIIKPIIVRLTIYNVSGVAIGIALIILANCLLTRRKKMRELTHYDEAETQKVEDTFNNYFDNNSK